MLSVTMRQYLKQKSKDKHKDFKLNPLPIRHLCVYFKFIMVPSKECLFKQIPHSTFTLTMPNAEIMFFIPYFKSPRRSCPSTHLFTGSFLRAAAGSLVFAHSSLHFTKYPFSARTRTWKYFNYTAKKHPPDLSLKQLKTGSFSHSNYTY